MNEQTDYGILVLSSLGSKPSPRAVRHVTTVVVSLYVQGTGSTVAIRLPDVDLGPAGEAGRICRFGTYGRQNWTIGPKN